jgi:hypothetical protein
MNRQSKCILVLLIATASTAMSQAHEPTHTTFYGTLLKAGKPFANAAIESCGDVASRGAAMCATPIRIRTNAKGQFSFVQATGYPPCTVCPCGKSQTSGGSSQVLSMHLSCDPSQSFWFRVLAGAESAEFNWWSHGYGIEGSVELTCDVRPSVSEVASARIFERDRFRLPSLFCVLKPGA